MKCSKKLLSKLIKHMKWTTDINDKKKKSLNSAPVRHSDYIEETEH